jgi:hypothetical protein
VVGGLAPEPQIAPAVDAVMKTKDEFLRLAAKAEDLAREISQPDAKKSMLQIAQVWRDLADQAPASPLVTPVALDPSFHTEAKAPRR